VEKQHDSAARVAAHGCVCGSLQQRLRLLRHGARARAGEAAGARARLACTGSSSGAARMSSRQHSGEGQLGVSAVARRARADNNTDTAAALPNTLARSLHIHCGAGPRVAQ
jgi:hypothetical protein